MKKNKQTNKQIRYQTKKQCFRLEMEVNQNNVTKHDEI